MLFALSSAVGGPMGQEGGQWSLEVLDRSRSVLLASAMV